MSRHGNPYDNAPAESFCNTLEHEQENLTEYGKLEEAAVSVGDFIEQIYS